MNTFWLTFMALFVAVNAVGVLPIFMGLTMGMPAKEVRPLILKSLAAAMVTAMAFIFFGQELLTAMGLDQGHFVIAGGIMLFLTAILDLMPGSGQKREVTPEDVGVVPIGVPLISGPAVLTTAILQSQLHGVWLTLAAMTLNLVIAGAIFWSSGLLYRILGQTGSRIFSKISHLFLAAFAISLIHHGVLLIIAMGMGGHPD